MKKTQRACPFCREDIRADALRCRHCGSDVAANRPRHGGVCPFCKEDVKRAAVLCKHCGADLHQRAAAPGCGCGGSDHPRTATVRLGPLGGGLGGAYDAVIWCKCLRWTVSCKTDADGNEECHEECAALQCDEDPPAVLRARRGGW